MSVGIQVGYRREVWGALHPIRILQSILWPCHAGIASYLLRSVCGLRKRQRRDSRVQGICGGAGGFPQSQNSGVIHKRVGKRAGGDEAANQRRSTPRNSQAQRGGVMNKRLKDMMKQLNFRKREDLKSHPKYSEMKEWRQERLDGNVFEQIDAKRFCVLRECDDTCFDGERGDLFWIQRGSEQIFCSDCIDAYRERAAEESYEEKA